LADIVLAALRKADRAAAPKAAGAPDLLAALQAAARAADTSSRIPILGCVRVTVSGGSLRLVGTDLEMVVTARLPSEFSDMDCVAPAKALVAAAKANPGALWVYDANDNVLTVGKARIACLDVADCPMLNAPSDASFAMPAPDLLRLLDPVRHAISTEETRYCLNGVHLECAGGNLIAVATDGNRLAIAETPEPAGARAAFGSSYILPRLVANELCRLLAKRSGDVTMRVGELRMAFEFDGLTVVTKLIDAEFPEYRRFIPSADCAEAVVTLDPDALAAAIKSVSAVWANARPLTKAVKLETADGVLRVTAHDAESGNAAAEAVPVTASGNMLSGFQARYLLDMCVAIRGRMEIHWQNKTAPILVHDTAQPGHRFVLMPCRV
jgi:DNA polymerase-3 subunit beta